jgi:hypothetical protein
MDKRIPLRESAGIIIATFQRQALYRHITISNKAKRQMAGYIMASTLSGGRFIILLYHKKRQLEQDIITAND